MAKGPGGQSAARLNFLAAHGADRGDLAPFLASFFTFAPAGFLVALVQTSVWTWPPAVAIAIFSGLSALGWSVALSDFRRRWWLLIPLNAAPFFVPQYIFTFMDRLGLLNYGAGMSQLSRRILFAALTVVMVSIGWSLMLRFIARTEGRNARLRTELDLASKIHRSLVPPIARRTSIVEVLGQSDPSSEMGGDLIDVRERDAGVDVFLADVSGHGVRAGVLMAMVKSSLRTASAGDAGPSAGTPTALSRLAERLNRVVCEVSEPDMFVTFSCLRIGAGGDIESVMAGHLPTLHWRAAARRVDVYDNQSLPLGVDPDEPFPTERISAATGDVLALYTDGLIEAMDAQGAMLGLGRFRAEFEALAERPLPEIRAGLLRLVRAHGPQNDDQTLLLVKIVG